jgi:hypothetical protein
MMQQQLLLWLTHSSPQTRLNLLCKQPEGSYVLPPMAMRSSTPAGAPPLATSCCDLQGLL